MVLLLVINNYVFTNRITRFIKTDFLMLLLNRQLPLSILILKAIGSTYKSKMFSSKSSLQAFKVYFRHEIFPLNNTIPPSFLSLLNIINLFDISFLANLYFYTIRSITMFLKVLNKVNFRVLTQT